MSKPIKDRLLEPIEVAKRLGMMSARDPHKWVLAQARKGVFESRRLGKYVRIKESSVDAFINGAPK